MTTIQETEPLSPTSSGSSVTRLAAVPLPPRRATAPAVNPAHEPSTQGPAVNQAQVLLAHVAQREALVDQKIHHNGQIIAVIHTLAKILAVRLYLFFALIGAFVLGWFAMDKGSWIAFAILIAYGVLTVIPLCVLDDRLHRRPEG